LVTTAALALIYTFVSITLILGQALVQQSQCLLWTERDKSFVPTSQNYWFEGKI